MTFPLQNTIAIDVDHTLLIKGNPNEVLIQWLKDNKEQYSYILWSMAGKEHALEVAQAFGIVELFDVIVSKPGYIIDDEGWSWVKRTKCLNNNLMNSINN